MVMENDVEKFRMGKRGVGTRVGQSRSWSSFWHTIWSKSRSRSRSMKEFFIQ